MPEVPESLLNGRINLRVNEGPVIGGFRGPVLNLDRVSKSRWMAAQLDPTGFQTRCTGDSSSSID
jgi:hypothetical protein